MQIKALYQQFLKTGKVCIDSREARPGTIFLGIRGERLNGNKFTGDALKNGAELAIVDDPEYAVGEKCVLVKDTIQTLQALASFHRQMLDIPIFAITGSNGKTTTKELMHRVFSEKYNVFSTPGNLNNHIGLPLSLLKINKSHEVAILELGANHTGENALLASIAQPDYGIITNIGKDHLEGFGSIEGIKKANSELFDYIRNNNGKAVVNIDDPAVREIGKDLEGTTYGTSKGKGIQPEYAGEVAGTSPFLNVQINREAGVDIKPWKVESQLFGRLHFQNIMCAVTCGRYFDVSPSSIIKAIHQYQPDNNRSQLIKTSKNTVLLDAYNANPTSMGAALDDFLDWDTSPKAVILGEMLELGQHSEKEHNEILHKLKSAGKNISKVLLVGNAYDQDAPLKNFMRFSTTEDIENHLKSNPLTGYKILIKGSRKLQLEQLMKHL